MNEWGWRSIAIKVSLLIVAAMVVAAAGAGAIIAGGGQEAGGPDAGEHRAGADGAVGRKAATETARKRARRVGSGRGGVRLARVGNFDQPVFVTGAPGFPRLLFVVEQPGRIRVVHMPSRRGRTFLDLRGVVRSGGEQGLLSIAFAPDYRRSGLFYAYYTDESGDIRIDEFRRRSPLRAAPGSRRQVIRITHREHANHNGGQMKFLGRHLYIGTGDGGGSGDPGENAQDRDSLLGKLLRIDPRRTQAGPYSVPRGNPFVGRQGRDEIFSLGLRNPWRFSFDRHTARRPLIAIADVGESAQEEVNYLPVTRARGANFGWNLREGFLPFESNRTSGLTDPVFAYGRDRGCSITGGYVVRDRRLPTLRGRYLFADFCEGQLRSFVPSLRRVGSAPNLGVSVDLPSSFGEDLLGRVYVTSLGGPVYRLVRTR